MPSVFVINFV